MWTEAIPNESTIVIIYPKPGDEKALNELRDIQGWFLNAPPPLDIPEPRCSVSGFAPDLEKAVNSCIESELPCDRYYFITYAYRHVELNKPRQGRREIPYLLPNMPEGARTIEARTLRVDWFELAKVGDNFVLTPRE